VALEIAQLAKSSKSVPKMALASQPAQNGILLLANQRRNGSSWHRAISWRLYQRQRNNRSLATLQLAAA
jgi:hypothetical protein